MKGLNPWQNEDGSTNVDGFLKAFAEHDNTFWFAEQGHILNVLEELIDRQAHLTELLGRAREGLEDIEKNTKSDTAARATVSFVNRLSKQLLTELSEVVK